jgi:hypothetical protein
MNSFPEAKLMLRCNHYLEPSPQGASDRKIPICLVNSAFNLSQRSARSYGGQRASAGFTDRVAGSSAAGSRCAPELAAPATTIGSVWVGSIHRRGRLQRQIATRASACCCHHKQRLPHQFRTRNDLVKTQRTRSNPNESAAKINGAGRCPVAHSGLVAGSSPAGPTTLRPDGLRVAQPCGAHQGKACPAQLERSESKDGLLYRSLRQRQAGWRAAANRSRHLAADKSFCTLSCLVICGVPFV